MQGEEQARSGVVRAERWEREKLRERSCSEWGKRLSGEEAQQLQLLDLS